MPDIPEPAAMVDATEESEKFALRVDEVSKQYMPFAFRRSSRRRARTTVNALSNISLQVRTGEMIGLLGPNGAGKTTLLKIITTLIYPSSGHVTIHGTDIAENPIEARAQMGLVTCDERSFYWRLTGRQNLEFFGRLYGLDKAQTRRRSDELLEMLGLSHAANRAYQKYSSGMRQKLAIARGLLGDPRIIFYDEPTRSLDPLSAQTIRDWILKKRLRSPEQTHVIATNQLSEAEKMCDRVFIINQGRLIAQGTIDEIRRLYPIQQHDDHLVTYRAGPDFSSLVTDAIDGLLEIEKDGEDEQGTRLRLRTVHGCTAFSVVIERLLTAGATIMSAQTKQVSFDEVFCSLVDTTPEPPNDEIRKPQL